MKVNLLFPISILVILCGCVPVYIGVGAVGGYTLSNDSAYGNINVQYRDLWDVCIEKFELEGLEILKTNESKGIIKARMSDTRIAVKIDTISFGVQRLKISARKYLLPKPQIAQDFFLKIIKEFE